MIPKYNCFIFAFRIVIDVLNMLQGVWIFLLFIVFNPVARKHFVAFVCCRNEPIVEQVNTFEMSGLNGEAGDEKED